MNTANNIMSRILMSFAVVMLCASCAKEPTVVARTCSIEYSLCSEVTKFISFDTINDGLRRAGLAVVSGEAEDNADFAITVSVTNFPSKEPDKSFCAFEYTINYKDTLFDVTPKIWIHGEVDAERVKLGFGYLNQNLRYVLDHFPVPKVGKKTENKKPNQSLEPTRIDDSSAIERR